MTALDHRLPLEPVEPESPLDAPLQASPGLRRVFVHDLVVPAPYGRLRFRADLLVREAPGADGDAIGGVLNYEGPVRTLRALGRQVLPTLHLLARQCCTACLAYPDVMEAQVQVFHETEGGVRRAVARARNPTTAA